MSAWPAWADSGRWDAREATCKLCAHRQLTQPDGREARRRTTIEEAIANGREALRDCVAVLQESGRKVPKPGIEAAQWRQRLPRTLYSKLTVQARNEGVSINSFVTAIIAEAIGAIGARQAHTEKRR